MKDLNNIHEKEEKEQEKRTEKKKGKKRKPNRRRERGEGIIETNRLLNLRAYTRARLHFHKI